jgi:glucose-1-phosphate adenylyltransferase
MEIADDVLVFLLAGGQGERLYPLTRDRAKPAVPFAGHHRIIDFTLTNCIHSGLRRVFVLTQYRSLSLERHLKNGYGFLPREMNEFIDSVPPQFSTGSSWYSGTADAICQNIDLIEQMRPPRVLVLSGDHVYRQNYRTMHLDHKMHDAAMTIGVVEVPIEEATRMGVLEVNEDFRVVGFEEKPARPRPIPGRSDVALGSMGIYLFETETLVREVMWDSKRETNHDFGRDIVPHMVKEGRKVYAYPFRDAVTDAAYWRDVGTIDAYYDAHKDILGANPVFDVRERSWPMFTATPRLPAAEILTSEGHTPEVVDAMISQGCVIAGARLQRSILGPDVQIGAGSEIIDSILLGRVSIGKRVRLNKVIVDHDVVIPDGAAIGIDAERDAREFLRSKGGVTVIAQGTKLGEA